MLGAVPFATMPLAGRLLGSARSGKAPLRPSAETVQPAKHTPQSLIYPSGGRRSSGGPRPPFPCRVGLACPQALPAPVPGA
eukprot:1568202-Alexandrium_andersonii.AAC.1